jgi:hypothetical protein
MWSRKLLLATLIAAAAVTMMRHGSTMAPGIAHTPSTMTTSLR